MGGGVGKAGGPGYFQHMKTLMDTAESASKKYVKVGITEQGGVQIEKKSGNPLDSMGLAEELDASAKNVRTLINNSFPNTKIAMQNGRQIGVGDYAMDSFRKAHKDKNGKVQLNAVAFKQINDKIYEGLEKAASQRGLGHTKLTTQTVAGIKERLDKATGGGRKKNAARDNIANLRADMMARAATVESLTTTLKAKMPNVETAHIRKVVDNALPQSAGGLSGDGIERDIKKLRSSGAFKEMARDAGIDPRTVDLRGSAAMKALDGTVAANRAFKASSLTSNHVRDYCAHLGPRAFDNDVRSTQNLNALQDHIAGHVEKLGRFMAKQGMGSAQEKAALLEQLQRDQQDVMAFAQKAQSMPGDKHVLVDCLLRQAGALHDMAMNLMPRPERDSIALRPPMTMNPGQLNAKARLWDVGTQAPAARTIILNATLLYTAPEDAANGRDLQNLTKKYDAAVKLVDVMLTKLKDTPRSDEALEGLAGAISDARVLGDELGVKLDRAVVDNQPGNGLFAKLFSGKKGARNHAVTVRQEIDRQQVKLCELDRMVTVVNDQRNLPEPLPGMHEADRDACRNRKAKGVAAPAGLPASRSTDASTALAKNRALLKNGFEKAKAAQHGAAQPDIAANVTVQSTQQNNATSQSNPQLSADSQINAGNQGVYGDDPFYGGQEPTTQPLSAPGIDSTGQSGVNGNVRIPDPVGTLSNDFEDISIVDTTIEEPPVQTQGFEAVLQDLASRDVDDFLAGIDGQIEKWFRDVEGADTLRTMLSEIADGTTAYDRQAVWNQINTVHENASIHAENNITLPPSPAQNAVVDALRGYVAENEADIIALYDDDDDVIVGIDAELTDNGDVNANTDVGNALQNEAPEANQSVFATPVSDQDATAYVAQALAQFDTVFGMDQIDLQELEGDFVAGRQPLKEALEAIRDQTATRETLADARRLLGEMTMALERSLVTSDPAGQRQAAGTALKSLTDFVTSIRAD